MSTASGVGGGSAADPAGVAVARRQLLGGWAATVALAGSAAALARRDRSRAPAATPGSGAPMAAPASVADASGMGATPLPGTAPVGAAAPSATGGPSTAAEPGASADGAERTPLTGEALVLHVARRCSWGPTPELLDELRAVGPMAWVDSQLDPSAGDDSGVEDEIADAAGFAVLGWSHQRAGGATDVDGRVLARALRHATLLRATRSRRQLREILVDVFTNHLNTWIGHPEAGRHVHRADADVIRQHALGRFADMLVASARSPAMLLYLDNAGSAAPSPNENYGRELLELHTVGAEAGYTEADVRGAATVLTGWTVGPGRDFLFDPGLHDPSPATVLGWSTPGHAGDDAVADGESLLAHLAHHPATARRVATVLARRFVADDPPADTIEEGAAAYLAAGTSIPATLGAILHGSAFGAGGEPKLRRPYEQVVAALRATGASISPYPRDGASWALDDALARCGQRLFDRAAPDGYPDRATAWASSSSLLARWTFVADLVHGRLAEIVVDPARLLTGVPASAAEALDHVAVALLGHPLPPERHGPILAFVGAAAGDAPDAVLDQLRAVAALVLSTPEAEHR